MITIFQATCFAVSGFSLGVSLASFVYMRKFKKLAAEFTSLSAEYHRITANFSVFLDSLPPELRDAMLDGKINLVKVTDPHTGQPTTTKH